MRGADDGPRTGRPSCFALTGSGSKSEREGNEDRIIGCRSGVPEKHKNAPFLKGLPTKTTL